MKQIKDLLKKAEDLRAKIRDNSAFLNIETPPYGENQATQIDNWMQAHRDIVREIERLRLAVQRTNLATKVAIELDGRTVTKPIAAWVHRRRDLSRLEMGAWGELTDRKLKESNIQTSPNGPVTEVRIRRFYDAANRDRHVELYRSEPSIIDGTLEVVNATTDLIEE
jgi:hypothetical protein